MDERWGYDSFPVDVLDPDAVLDVPAISDDGINKDRDYSQFGLCGQANLALTDKSIAIVGVRVNCAEMTSDNTGSNLQDYKEDAFVTPLAGLVYKVTPDTSLYASYGMTAREPVCSRRSWSAAASSGHQRPMAQW